MIASLVAHVRRRMFDGQGGLTDGAAVVLLVLVVCGLMLAAGAKLTTSPAAAAAALVVGVAAAVMLHDMRLALFAFAVFLFGYEEFDLSSTEAFFSEQNSTVLGVRILGVSLMDFLSALLLVPVLVREWSIARRTGRVRVFDADLLLVPIVLLWVYGAVLGLFHTRTMSTYTWELRDLGHVVVFYIIFSRTFARRSDVLVFLAVGAATFLLKNGVFIARWMRGGGLDVTGGEYSRILLGSDLTLTAFFLCVTVAAQLVVRPMPRAARVGLALLAMYLTIMLMAGLGRLTYLLTAGGLVMIFVLNRRQVRTRTIVATVGVGLIAAWTFFTYALDEGSSRMITYALSSAFSWKDAIALYGDLSIGARVLEAINIWSTLSAKGAVLWGLGWGAPWQEYILHPFDIGSFDIMDQIRGVHVNAHVDAVQFMLKLGVVGTVLLYATFVRIWRRGVRVYHATTGSLDRLTLLAVLTLIVVIVPNFIYFIRLKFLLGFAIAAVALFIRTHAADDAAQDVRAAALPPAQDASRRDAADDDAEARHA